VLKHFITASALELSGAGFVRDLGWGRALPCDVCMHV